MSRPLGTEAGWAVTDRELGLRLEAGEARATAAIVRGWEARHDSESVALLAQGGWLATFVAGEEDLSRVYGLGAEGSDLAGELETLEEFYFRHGARRVTIEVAPFVDEALVPLLRARGYGLQELRQVWVYDLAQEVPLSSEGRGPGPEIDRNGEGRDGDSGPFGLEASRHDIGRIRIEVPVTSLGIWAATVAEGFMEREPTPREVAFYLGNANVFGHVAVLAWLDGRAAGAASLALDGEIAALFGGSTVPAMRRRGVQGALLQSRLQWARDAGARWATISTRPGTASGRNVERVGFRVAYLKGTFVGPGAIRQRVRVGIAKPTGRRYGRTDDPAPDLRAQRSIGLSRDDSEVPFGRWDGHVHSAFARHGADFRETTSTFVREAVRQGFQRLTFTEHAFFPVGRVEPALHRGVYLDPQDLDAYARTVLALRKRFAGAIDVRLGFEVDFVPGAPDDPLTYLGRYAPYVQDAILSVHFLPAGQPRGGLPATLPRREPLVPLDVNAQAFRAGFLSGTEDLDAIRARYWDTVEAAVWSARSWNTGIAWRIGHLDVVGKFARALPGFDRELDRKRGFRVLHAIRAAGFGLDVNASGLDVPQRQEAYPAAVFLAEALRLGIPLVYGSDAHCVRDVGRHRAELTEWIAHLKGHRAPDGTWGMA